MNTCANCGTPREAGHRYCWSCGALLDAKRELKQATVLLADLCGSTELLAHGDAERGQEVLDLALQVMSDAVVGYGGTRMQWRGDELLALFGAPLAQEDHALRACLAAAAMHEGMKIRSTAGSPLAVRIGIHSGEVLVGPGGEAVASSYRADGLTIHQASRLERLAEPGSTLISGATQRLTGGQLETRSRGLHALRGIAGQVEVFELLAQPSGSAAAPLARRRHLSPLLGRDELFDELVALARLTREQRTLRALGLRGDAGVGKSRFVDTLCERLRADGVATVTVAAHAYASDVPFRLLGDMVRVLLALPAEPGADPAHHEPALAELLDRGDPGDHWRALSPPQRRQRIADTAIWLTSERAGRAPLVMVIEDLFLSDRESLRLLEGLLPHLAGQPLLLLVTYRSDFVHPWSDVPWFAERRLEPLPGATMEQLSAQLLGDDPSLAAIRAALLERAAGNPFYFEQLVFTLIDDGSLLGTPGAYRAAAGDAAAPRVPASIMAVISARVDRLSPAAKASLEAAAVIGEPIGAGTLAAMQEIDIASVESHLRLALASGLIGAGSALGSGVYGFRHALVQDAVAASLPRSRRRALHRAALGALSQRGGDASVLAHHAYHGEDWPAAAEHALRAMVRSIARSANRDALRLFEQGLAAIAHIEASPQRMAAELALRFEAPGAMMALGRIDAIVENLERAGALARELGEPRRQAAIWLQLAFSLWSLAGYARGLEAAANCEDAARAAGSRNLQMSAIQARMMLNHGLGRYDEASADAARLLDEFGDALALRRLLPGWAVLPAVNAWCFRADLLSLAGRHADAQRACDAAYREVQGEHEHAFSHILADFAQAGVLIAQQRSAEAAALLEKALAMCLRHDVPTMYPTILARLCGALALSGQAARALALLEPADAAQAWREGGRYNDFYFAYYLALALREAGRLDDAAAAAERALAVASGFEQSGHAAMAQRLREQIDPGRASAAPGP